MYKLLMVLCISLSPVLQAYAQAPESVEPALEIYGNACEKVISGESKSSTRVRATDKAVFLGVKRLDSLSRAKQILNEHDQNVMIYRLVDEYVEDLTVKTVEENDAKVCVEVKGWLSPGAISEVEKEFIADNSPVNEATPEAVVEVAREVKEDISLSPQNPESLALLHIKTLEYYNGGKSGKYTQILKEQFADNPYFYLTDDAEIACVAERYGAKVPFMRSEETSNDFAGTDDVLLEVLEQYQQRGQEFDNLCCLYSTAPFVTPQRLTEAFDKLDATIDFVFTCVAYSYPIQRGLHIVDGKIGMLWPEYANSRSQDLETSYHDAGQFYLARVASFLEEKTLWGKNTAGLILSELEVQDLDTITDWELAEMKYRLLHS